MLKSVCLILLAVGSAAWLPDGSEARAESLPCLVTGVPAGDSLRVVCAGSPQEVKLHGVLCPTPDEFYGRQARQFVQRLVMGREVGVEIVRRESPSQVVAKVILEDGKFLSHELLQNGLARVDPQATVEDVKLEILQGLAKDLRMGLWAGATGETAVLQTGEKASVATGKGPVQKSPKTTAPEGIVAAGAGILVAALFGALAFFAWRRRRTGAQAVGLETFPIQRGRRSVRARAEAEAEIEEGRQAESLAEGRKVVEGLLESLVLFVRQMVENNTSYTSRMADHKASVKRAMTLAGLQEIQRLLLEEIEGMQTTSESYRAQLDSACRTIQEQQERIRQSEAAAKVDFLTRLANRRAFEERLSEELERVRRYGGTFSLILLDIDEFKKVNDEFGHPAGDRVLKFIAAVLTEKVRATDFVSRYGGEEFAVLLPETSADRARVVAEKIRKTLQNSSLMHGKTKIKVTVSAGVGGVKPDGESLADLVARVDAALYQAKKKGRNCVEQAV